MTELPDELVARQALEHYQLPGPAHLALLRHGENAVYRVDAGEGTWALRLSAPGAISAHEVRSELTWMHELRQAGIGAPEVVPSRAGDVLASLRDDAGPDVAQHAVLLRWIDAPQLAVGDPAPVAQELGRLLASLHAHAIQWAMPLWFSRVSWDADALTGASPRWGNFQAAADWNPQVLRDLEAANETVRHQLQRLGTGSDRYGLIHADPTPTNVMVGRDALHIIDFDDCGDGWFAYDVAVALWEYESHPQIGELTAAVLAGYEDHAGALPPGFEMLPVFTMARRLALLGWMHTRGRTGHANATRDRRLATTPASVRRFLDWAAATID